MITTLFTLMLFYFINYRERDFYILFCAIAFFVLLIHLFISTLSSNIYMYSDELYYYFESEKVLLDQSRRIYGIINWIYARDILGYYFVKSFNIPIVATVILLLSKLLAISPYRILIWNPYLLIFATLNLRDALILLVLLISLVNSRKLQKIITILILLNLRPLMAIVPAINFGIYFRRYLLILVGMPFAGLVSYYLYSENSSAILWYITETGFEDRLSKSNQSELYQGSLGRSVFYGLVRYIFTPIPSSLINEYLLKGNFSDFGIIHDLFRLLGQMFYYVALFRVAWFYRRIISFVKRYRSLVIMALVYFMIYGFYNLGGGHQRIKVPFQICVTTMSLVISKSNYGYNRSIRF